MPTEIIIIGSGGHSKVVVEALNSNYDNKLINIVDNDKSREGMPFLSKYKIGSLHDWIEKDVLFHTAIGNNFHRRTISKKALIEGKVFHNIMHNKSFISESAILGSGIFVAAQAIISSESRIQDGCIINHSSIVDHDCFIGEYSHIAPNVTLGGGVQIGSDCLIGSGATILPNIKIGNGVVVGAGSVITKDINENQIIIGNPGRVKK